jgi:alpha-tubulin suppressor-like RCC1 family protein
VWLFAFAGCYRGPSGLAPCTIRCTDGCPQGTTCTGGYCSSDGASCTQDAPACGGVGEACCATAPECNGNSYCSQGTCTAGCVTEVGLGRHHTCVVEHDGSVWCSGGNDRGQLGHGTVDTGTSTFARATDAAGPIVDATAVSGGFDFSCAVRTGGTVWCWGAGLSGQLGNNAVGDSAVAVQVVLATTEPLTGITQLVSGRAHTCGLASDQTIYCWGDNGRGQLGDGTGAARATAAQVPGITGVMSFAGGDTHACTLDATGQLQCWGANGNGQIGDGTQTDALSPVTLALANVSMIATGQYHTCAVLSDSSMLCWGANTRRWLGTSTNPNSRGNVLNPTPVLSSDGVTPYSGVTALALGSVSCVLHGGHVECWGDDIHGQSGAGGSLYPRAIVFESGAKVTNVDRLIAHYPHVCAHRTDGSIMCWGRGSEGELGDGKLENRAYPVPIGASCEAGGSPR